MGLVRIPTKHPPNLPQLCLQGCQKSSGSNFSDGFFGVLFKLVLQLLYTILFVKKWYITVVEKVWKEPRKSRLKNYCQDFSDTLYNSAIRVILWNRSLATCFTIKLPTCSVGLCPRARIAIPNSLVEIVELWSLSNMRKASRNPSSSS